MPGFPTILRVLTGLRSHHEKSAEMSVAHKIATRFSLLTWERNGARERSQILLMQEFMRRSAWWVQHIIDNRTDLGRAGTALWPFGDLAYYLAPSVRAGDDLLALADRGLDAMSLHSVTRETCHRSIHFGAVQDANVAVPSLPEPYDPLIMMFERGDFFTPRPGGHMDVGTTDMRTGKMERYLVEESFVAVDAIELNAIDSAAS